MGFHFRMCTLEGMQSVSSFPRRSPRSGPSNTCRAVRQTDPEWDPPRENSFSGLCTSFSSSVVSLALSSVLPLRTASGLAQAGGRFHLQILGSGGFSPVSISL